MLPFTLFHPVVAFSLVNLLAAALWSDPATILGPSAFYLLIRIQFRLRGIIEAFVVHVPLMAPVVAFLLVYILSSPRHIHHAAVSPKLALHQFFRIAAVIVIGDRRGRETVANFVYILESVLVDAILLVNAASPWYRSYLTSCCRV